MSTRLAGLVIGILLAASTLAAAQTKPAATALTPAQIAALRAAQLAAQPQRMPNLVGQTVQSAQQDSQVRGLKLQLVPRNQPTRNQKPGVIVGHEPAAGAAVRAGMTVTVFVAVPERDTSPEAGRATVPIPVVRVPLVEGMTVEQATDVLARRGLQIQPRPLLTTRARAGTVVDQTPEANTAVKPRSFVDVMVAQAPPDRPVPEVTLEMPRVIGMEMQQGAVLLSKMNLAVQRQFTDAARVAPGTIVDQKPAPGTIVREKSTVQILVSQAPPQQPPNPGPDRNPVPNPGPDRNPVPNPGPTTPPPRLFPMPDLVGRTFTMAERDPRVINLKLRLIPQDDFVAPGLPGTIARQAVPAGSGIEVGRSVTVVLATGVVVPQVVEQQADLAERRLTASGLNARRNEEVSDQMSGLVLRQVPEAGVVVARGAAVAITIAVPKRVPVPNVVGRTRVDAVQELARLRLRASPADDGASLLPPEQVLSQVPSAGTEVVVGAAVRIVVSTGVEVPNLSGLSSDEAQRAVAERGLSFEDTDQETDAVPAGQVFQQQPVSGTRVTRGSRVLATVAVAVPVVVPNVVGVTRLRAVALLDAAGLRADAAPDATASSRLVERQQPAANTRVARLTTVALFVAAPARQPPTQQPEPLAPVPAPVPSPVPGPDPTPVPAVQVAPSAAVPVQPLLPPWLLTLLVALAAIGVSTFRLWWPGSSPPPPIQAATPATPPPGIDVRPERGDAALRLEVTGRSLISMDVRVRVQRGPAEQTLDVQGDALVVEERRLYE
jgi:beta-lactam-binding protein with PASTA domain